jgi:hypothetical protein
MFQTIERQSGGGGGFLSDHPSPKDRYARINQEAQLLRVTNPINDTREFAGVQERLRSYPRAPSMAEIQRTGQRYPAERNGGGGVSTDRPNGRVDYPSTRLQNYQILNGDVQVSVPNNWRQIDDSNSVWFVPEGAYGQYNGQAVFTHGVNFGVAQTNSRNLQQATNELISNLAQGNGNLRVNGSYQRTTFGGRNAIWTSLINTNEATGRPESVRLIATQLRNGQLLYMMAVAPQNERNFETAFQSVSNSVRIND